MSKSGSEFLWWMMHIKSYVVWKKSWIREQTVWNELFFFTDVWTSAKMNDGYREAENEYVLDTWRVWYLKLKEIESKNKEIAECVFGDLI